MEKIKFSKKIPLKSLEKKRIFNFINLEGIYFYNKNKKYKEAINSNSSENFCDGGVLALITNRKQNRGPSFTLNFLKSKEAKEKKHFFISSPKNSIKEISKFSEILENQLKLFVPSFIKEYEFSKKERGIILKEIKKFNPDFIWVAIGAPKQEILSYQLFLEFPCKYFNIGAGLDFFTQKKKSAPRIVQIAKIEWLYRLLTDFKHVRPKVLRSFYGLYKII
jgi:exopolysaccharide biosynthesis WecB/TagA/CpsF family protein